MSIEKKLYELKLDILQSEMYPSLRKKLADQIHEIEMLINTDKTELNLHSVSKCDTIGYADCLHWQNSQNGCDGCTKEYKPYVC